MRYSVGTEFHFKGIVGDKPKTPMYGYIHEIENDNYIISWQTGTGGKPSYNSRYQYTESQLSGVISNIENGNYGPNPVTVKNRVILPEDLFNV